MVMCFFIQRLGYFTSWCDMPKYYQSDMIPSFVKTHTLESEFRKNYYYYLISLLFWFDNFLLFFKSKTYDIFLWLKGVLLKSTN